MAGYTKLFSTIITSSIWSEDDKTRIMWITMLALADSKGRVSGSIPGLAQMARMSITDADACLRVLTAADAFSRTPNHEGRRVLEIPGGWQIANYAKYRQGRDVEKRREQNREAQKRYRARKQKVSQNKPQSAQAEAEAEAEALKKESIKERKRRKPFVPPTLEEVQAYIRENNLAVDGSIFVKYFSDGEWIDSRGQPVRNWKQKLLTWAGRHRASGDKPKVKVGESLCACGCGRAGSMVVSDRHFAGDSCRKKVLGW